MIYFLLFTFFLDYASFPYRGRIYKTEIYYQVSYKDLIFWTKNDSLLSRCSFIFNIKTRDKQIADTVNKTITIESYDVAKRRDFSIIDQYGIFLLPGAVEYEVIFSCSSKAETISGSMALNKIESNLLLSDVELALAAYPDTVRTPFSKAGLTVVPNPSTIFGGRWKVIYPYVEIHNLIPDSNYYTITYSIEDTSSKTVKKVKERSQKIFEAQNEVIGIDISNLKAGNFSLKVAVEDATTGKKIERSKNFEIVTTDIPEITFDYEKYDDLIRKILDGAEYQRYLKLSPAGKQAYLKRFLRSDEYKEFQILIGDVDKKFRVGKKLGSKTDRGLIYIKYGRPDEIIKKYYDGPIKPVEHWFYYASGFHYIFMDFSETGDYRLLWSNSNKEENYQNWEKYFPKEFIDQY